MRVAIVGSGYVGLVTGACLADLGHSVICLDKDQRRIDGLRAGRMPIYEPGLEELAGRESKAGRLRFTTDYREAVHGAEVVFICVGTPPRPDGKTDTSALEQAAAEIGANLGSQYTVIVNKSTVPIGSGDWVRMLVSKGGAVRHENRVREEHGSARGGSLVMERPTALRADFDVVSNPEFLREGTAIEDAMNPDRIVIGTESERAEDVIRALYAPLMERCAASGRAVPLILTDRASAEMIKYAANAFLSTKISFINEIANLCQKVGADVREVSRGIGLDARIGPSFLHAGIGWGGSCFPKDLASLIATGREYGYEARLLESVRQVNASQRLSVILKLQERLKLLKGKTIVLWGIAFKPGTDDLRDAPALDIAEVLTGLGAAVRACDPKGAENAVRLGIQAEVFDCPYEAAHGADAGILVTEWEEYKSLDWARVRAGMNRAIVVDGRNALDRDLLLSHGFEYMGIGR